MVFEDGGRLRPIMHRASLSEMVVPYGDPTPLHGWKNAFDAGEWGLGRMTQPGKQRIVDHEAAFEQPFDHGAPRHFDGDGDPLRLARRQRPEPVRQPGQTGAIMVNGPFPHPATVAVEHTDLMLL